MRNHLHREQIVRGVFAIITSHPHATDRFLLEALLILKDGADDRQVKQNVHICRMIALMEVCKQLKDNPIVHQRL